MRLSELFDFDAVDQDTPSVQPVKTPNYAAGMLEGVRTPDTPLGAAAILTMVLTANKDLPLSVPSVSAGFVWAGLSLMVANGMCPSEIRSYLDRSTEMLTEVYNLNVAKAGA